MKKHSIFFILIAFSLFVGGCKYDFILPEVVPSMDNISFATQITHIFADKCTECHKTGGTAPNLTAASAYNQIMAGYVNLTTPEQSKILTFPGSSSHSWKKFTATESATILKWISEGAKNN